MRGDGDHQIRAVERRRVGGEIGGRIDAAEQHIGLERRLQHGARRQANGRSRRAARFTVRHRARKVCARRIGAFGDAIQRWPRTARPALPPAP